MERNASHYYEARGFSVYYLCNAVFNVITNDMDYLRGIEDILGDATIGWLMKPFKRHTNLHHFIEAVASSVLRDELAGDGDPRFMSKFLEVFQVPFDAANLTDEDAFYEFASESQRYAEAVDELTDEVFHVLFNDVGLLQTFNRICANYITDGGFFGEEHTTRTGTLKRVAIPAWARRAIFHRDKGECRDCKRSLAAIINKLDRGCYDHIVPLAAFGANDVTNLQLLCEPCNLKKAAKERPASRLYQKAITR